MNFGLDPVFFARQYTSIRQDVPIPVAFNNYIRGKKSRHCTRKRLSLEVILLCLAIMSEIVGTASCRPMLFC